MKTNHLLPVDIDRLEQGCAPNKLSTILLQHCYNVTMLYLWGIVQYSIENVLLHKSIEYFIL